MQGGLGTAGGSWTKADSQLYQHVQEKSQLEKKSSQLPAASKPAALGPQGMLGLGLHLCKHLLAMHPLHPAWMQGCSCVPCSEHGEWHMLGYPHLHSAMCGLTQHCYHLEGLGLRTETTSTGSSRDQQAGLGVVLVWLCSPVFSAYLGTVARGQAGTSPAGRARHSGWGAGDAWSCPSCLGLC